MKSPDPKADMYLAKAKRFRQRAAGFRHTLKRDDLMRAHRLELEQMVVNLEGAAKQLERMAGGADFQMEAELDRVRAVRDGAPVPSTAATQRFFAAADNVARNRTVNHLGKKPGAAPVPATKPAPGRMAPRSAKYSRRPGT
ncbi:MAG: hypothetical protein O9320_03655 [Magnetospirillum sp.]|nr:hypothetical protein [Magnetospirillum sp.]